MASSYSFSLNYANGRMASKDYFSQETAMKLAAELSVKKKRMIIVRAHTFNWYNDMNKPWACFENGKRQW